MWLLIMPAQFTASLLCTTGFSTAVCLHTRTMWHSRSPIAIRGTPVNNPLRAGWPGFDFRLTTYVRGQEHFHAPLSVQGVMLRHRGNLTFHVSNWGRVCWTSVTRNARSSLSLALSLSPGRERATLGRYERGSCITTQRRHPVVKPVSMGTEHTGEARDGDLLQSAIHGLVCSAPGNGFIRWLLRHVSQLLKKLLNQLTKEN
jgi:hypothetical protein